jgi:hypothetical protein
MKGSREGYEGRADAWHEAVAWAEAVRREVGPYVNTEGRWLRRAGRDGCRYGGAFEHRLQAGSYLGT